MASSSFPRLAAAAALGVVLLPAVPSSVLAQEASKTVAPRAESATCGKPEWPKAALQLEQEGEVTLAFLVNPQGTVQESKIAVSSGFPMLDAAARDGLAKCRFTPGTQDGKPVAAWTQTKFAWSLKAGAPTALERTYTTGGSDIKEMVVGMADRGEAPAMVELTKAAIKGDVVAQLWMAGRYENGKGVPRDEQAAATWYGRAAASGNARAKAALARLQPPATAGEPPAAGQESTSPAAAAQ